MITNKIIVELTKILKKDSELRNAEFEKYKNLSPRPENYNIEKIKNIWPDAHYFHFHDQEGLYGLYEDKLIFLFRGSDSLPDWISNFIFFLRKIPYDKHIVNNKIKVHSGFFNTYYRIRNEIHKIVKQYNTKDVIFHGRSKGAAIASLAALDIQYNNEDKNVKIFTSASPRIGNKYFAESFNRRFPDAIRLERHNDLVTITPPKIFGYIHFGKEIKVGKKHLIYRFAYHNFDFYIKDILKYFEE